MSNAQSNEFLRSIAKPDIYSSSLEANITGSGVSSSSRENLTKGSPIQIREAKIMNSSSPKSSPIQKSFVPPKAPLVPSNPFKEDDYDEAKNPFAEDDGNDKNPFKDDADDDYDKNLNPFAS